MTKKILELENMKASIYDPERMKKISQIMPEFGRVAKPGDEVELGLKGDTLFPQKFETNRPTAVIQNVTVLNPNETLVTLKTNRGETKTLSTLSLKPDEIWEFSDNAFRGVLEREQANYAPRDAALAAVRQNGLALEFASANLKNDALKNDREVVLAARQNGGALRYASDDLRRELRELRAELAAEKGNSRNFQNTVIASMKEMASDIIKIDANNNRAEFSRVFKSEYTKMENRSEGNVNRSEMTVKNETPMGMLSDDSMSDYDSDAA